jgi:hypothetical protein
MDGAVLADALLDPTAAEISSQAANASDLTSHQNALMEQSTRDIRWYRKNRIEAPPSATPQP